MNTQKKGRTPIYENSFKVAIAREYLTGNSSHGELAKKYGLLRSETVRHFVKWYKAHHLEDIEHSDLSTYESGVSPDSKAISKELQQANLKIAGLEMLIEIAGKELGVDLVKKLGTKQLKK